LSAAFDVGSLLKAYSFHLRYARELVRDISRQPMYESQGPGLENHPAFSIGHLVIASALVAEQLGTAYNVPAGWDELFRRTGPGDSRLPVQYREGLPTKEELLSELGHKHAVVEQMLGGLPVECLAVPVQWRFDRYFPSLADYLTFMCVTHEAMHLGQIAAWRRAVELSSALASV
jgi:hypothetical protein